MQGNYFVQGRQVKIAHGHGSPATLDDLDRRQDMLRGEQEATLPLLPPLVENTPRAVQLKVRVVAGQIWPDEHPEAHALLRSAIRDLGHLT